MRRRGAVMILSLIVIAAITSVLAVYAANQQVDVRATIHRLETSRAELAAEAGIQRALVELSLVESPSNVTTAGTWYTLGTQGDESFLVGRDSFRLEIRDAGSFVSLNSATQAQLEALGLSTEQIDSLLDWREPGNVPRPEGAKNEFYNALTEPYNAAQKPLTTFEELLLIRGFYPAVLYEPLAEIGTPTFIEAEIRRSLYQMTTVDSGNPNMDGGGQQRQDINAANVGQLTQAGIPAPIAAAIIARRGGGFASMGDVLQTPGLNNQTGGVLLDRFSIGGDARQIGRVNVNTASIEVLTTLPGITQETAETIFSNQSTGYGNLSEVLNIPGVGVAGIAQFADLISVGSDTFRVRVEGIAGQSRVALEAIVRLEGGSARVIKLLRPPQGDMRTIWEWSEETTGEIDLGADNS